MMMSASSGNGDETVVLVICDVEREDVEMQVNMCTNMSQLCELLVERFSNSRSSENSAGDDPDSDPDCGEEAHWGELEDAPPGRVRFHSEDLHWTSLTFHLLALDDELQEAAVKPCSEADTLGCVLGEHQGEVRLRVHTVQDSLTRSRIEKKRHHLQFDVEAWYPALEHYTFPTVFFNLSFELAEAIVAFYRSYWYFEKLDVIHIGHIDALCKQLEPTIEEMGSCFVRLSSRSPKDSVSPFCPSLMEHFEIEQLQAELDNDATSEQIYNSKLSALARAQAQLLLSETVEDAVHRILTSERVFVDLNEAISAQEDKSEVWTTQIQVRQWEPRLNDALEFRCFVKDRELCAISQYNHYCLFPKLAPIMPDVVERITAYWNSFRDAVEPDSYIVDIGLLTDNEDWSGPYDLVVIELNPYQTTTGGSMFDWGHDKDALSSPPVTVRIREMILPSIEEWWEYNHQELEKGIDFRPYTDVLDHYREKDEEDGLCIIF